VEINNYKVAYLVVCWNNRKIIAECLDSLLQQDYSNKIIYVIDNASSDGSADYIEKSYPTVRLVRSNDNNGFAKGNNILAKKALSEDETVKYVALINSDLVLDKHWTTEIVNFIAKKRHIAAAQGVTLDYYDHNMIDSTHIYIANNFQSIQYDYNKYFKNTYAYSRKVFGINAAAAIYTRDFIEKQPNRDLLEEKFYMYLEDVDVSLRAIVLGWNNYYVSTARAYHMGSASSKKRANDYALYMTYRNQAALLFKNLSLKTIFKFMPTMIKDDLHFYKHIKNNRGIGVALGLLYNRLLGLVRLPLYICDRIEIRHLAKRSDEEIERVMRQKGIF
jgi:GT2 family glycosyltransferase